MREHRAVPKNTRLWWGGIRNLLGRRHHRVSSQSLRRRSVRQRICRPRHARFRLGALVADGPRSCREAQRAPAAISLSSFISAEGVDAQSAEEIFRLARERALDDRTVIVHGLGLDERGLALLQSVRCGADLVSRRRTLSCLAARTIATRFESRSQGGSRKRFAAHGARRSAGRNSLRARNRRDARRRLVFPGDHPCRAGACGCETAKGTLRIGALADFVGVRDTGLSPAQTLASLSQPRRRTRRHRRLRATRFPRDARAACPAL